MNAFKAVGIALFVVVYAILCIPFAVAYYMIGSVLAVVTFTVCGVLVMVYKFSAWLSRLSR